MVPDFANYGIEKDDVLLGHNSMEFVPTISPDSQMPPLVDGLKSATGR